jgi:hypothetical protein
LRKREEDEREKRGRKYRERVRKESIQRIEEERGKRCCFSSKVRDSGILIKSFYRWNY